MNTGIGFLTAFAILGGCAQMDGWNQEARTTKEDSYIRCRLRGGNIAGSDIFFEFYKSGDETWLQVSRPQPQTAKPLSPKRVRIPPAAYDRLWDWIKAEHVWDLPDAVFAAEDAVTWEFQLALGSTVKSFRAMGIDLLPNKKYLSFFSLLDETRKKYLPDK